MKPVKMKKNRFLDFLSESMFGASNYDVKYRNFDAHNTCNFFWNTLFVTVFSPFVINGHLLNGFLYCLWRIDKNDGRFYFPAIIFTLANIPLGFFGILLSAGILGYWLNTDVLINFPPASLAAMFIIGSMISSIVIVALLATIFSFWKFAIKPIIGFVMPLFSHLPDINFYKIFGLELLDELKDKLCRPIEWED